MAKSSCIGELNGKWSWIFKLALVLIPILAARVELNNRAIASSFKEIEDDNTKLCERVASIEANKFTSDDGLAVWKEIGDIRSSIAEFPDIIPPPWLIDRLDRLEKKVDVLSERIP